MQRKTLWHTPLSKVYAARVFFAAVHNLSVTSYFCVADCISIGNTICYIDYSRVITKACGNTTQVVNLDASADG